MGCCIKMLVSSNTNILLMETQTNEIASEFILSSGSIGEATDTVLFDLKLSCNELYEVLLINIYGYCIIRHTV
jgi:hypothetical protein